MTSAVPYAEVIGDPVSHSKSPLIHRFWLKKLGIAADYRVARVTQAELADYFDKRRQDSHWRGCNITMPLKESSLPFAALRAREVELVKATNCMVPGADRSLIAHNTDVDGFREACRSGCERQMPRGPRGGLEFILIGTGGAARAALAVLAGEDVTIFGRDLAKAWALSEEFGLGGKGCHAHIDELTKPPFVLDPTSPGGKPDRGETQRCDLVVINATSLGMSGRPPLPIRLDSYPENTVVIDMVYDPLETPLLLEARRLGMVTVDGLAMLVGQAAKAFELFFGRPAPRENDAELRTLLAA